MVSGGPTGTSECSIVVSNILKRQWMHQEAILGVRSAPPAGRSRAGVGLREWPLCSQFSVKTHKNTTANSELQVRFWPKRLPLAQALSVSLRKLPTHPVTQPTQLAHHHTRAQTHSAYPPPTPTTSHPSNPSPCSQSGDTLSHEKVSPRMGV